MSPEDAQDDKGAEALDKESGRQCASPLCAGARHSTINLLAAARVLVNAHQLLSEWDALHHGCMALIKDIDSQGGTSCGCSGYSARRGG